MNNYIETRIELTHCNETATDVLAAMLAEVGYESFVADAHGLTAYVAEGLFDAEALQQIVNTAPLAGAVVAQVTNTTVEGRDWNSEWEKHYFQPIVVDGRCVIHSSFHTGYPSCEYDILIDPKMAFGTGHHATTSLIIARLLALPLEGMRIVDMGTGTGILAILAAMRGAAGLIAVEIDPFAYANAIENVALNNQTASIRLVNGDASALNGVEGVDLFIANINRNVILNDMGAYVATMKSGARMILSGFYLDDVQLLEEAGMKHGLKLIDVTSRDNWASLCLEKL